MKTISSISDLPNVPSVYAMYGGKGRGQYVAYVGIADKLKRRIIQHLINRDSSVATGTSAVGLNPDYVTEVRWWEYQGFKDRHFLVAAELVAFEVLDPALRSRGGIQQRSKDFYNNKSFRNSMLSLFSSEPTGCLTLPTLHDALEKIAELEQRLEEVKAKGNRGKTR